ncbi:MAG: TonB-dependent receptor [Bacteroidales bacterium]|nr:TonB-dependent receptor [Candidatus Colicola faecequi]
MRFTKSILTLMAMLFMSASLFAQITTANLGGVISDKNDAAETMVGAVVKATYTPTGQVYYATTDAAGNYNFHNIVAGGPYDVEVQTLGYRNLKVTGVYLNLADNNTLNLAVEQESFGVDEIVVTAQDLSNMASNRAGALTTISAATMAVTPSTSRSMNDVMALTPQATVTSNGFAVGGGNYRQSNVTVDGAAFNNGFGIGSNLPAGGTPISLDALDQMAISITPYDVRQSGFTGGAIQATTKSGTNEWKFSVYDYFKNDALQGKKYGDLVNGARKELVLAKSLQNTVGFTVGGPIVKNKLFFFLNAEYDVDNNPGQNYIARPNDAAEWGNGTQVNRPTEAFLQEVSSYVKDKYGYETGAYQGYSFNSPDWKILARLDWRINNNHSINLRYSYTHNYYTTRPSSSISPLPSSVYDKNNNGRQSQCAMYYQNSCYNQEQNFGSLAAEWKSRFAEGNGNNILRATWSHQYEPRSYNGGLFPTVDILGEEINGKPSVLCSFGTDPFTFGNLRDVHTVNITDDVTYTVGKHTVTAGAQFEWNSGKNGFMQMGNGYFLYNSWEDFKNQATPLAFVMTHPNDDNPANQQFPTIATTKYSVYAQDEIDLHKQFKMTVGLRLEMPSYPTLDNENKQFTEIYKETTGWQTNQVPKAYLNISPRLGFNWDVLGNKRMIVRGGTGVFAGNLPMVWLVSAVGNSNTMQNQLIWHSGNENLEKFNGHFGATREEILQTIYGAEGFKKTDDLAAPSATTVIAKDLRMPTTWKSSLAVDFNLPNSWKLGFEGIFNKDLNAVVVRKEGYKADADLVMTEGHTFDARKHYVKDPAQNGITPYLITNSEETGYYGSFTAKVEKAWNCGINLMAAYTYSRSIGVNDGVGDQVTGILSSVGSATANGGNDAELGYSSYVSPHRLVATLSYVIPEKIGSTTLALHYEGQQIGYLSGISYTTWTPTMDKDLSGLGTTNPTIYIPTEEQLEVMNFASDANKEEFNAWISANKALDAQRGSFATRGCMTMPWHNQLDFKFMQNFFVADGTGRKHNLEVGMDIKNLLNLVNPAWGTYKNITSTNVLSWKDGVYTFKDTTKPAVYANTASTWSIMFSARYFF